MDKNREVLFMSTGRCNFTVNYTGHSVYEKPGVACGFGKDYVKEFTVYSET